LPEHAVNFFSEILELSLDDVDDVDDDDADVLMLVDDRGEPQPFADNKTVPAAKVSTDHCIHRFFFNLLLLFGTPFITCCFCAILAANFSFPSLLASFLFSYFICCCWLLFYVSHIKSIMLSSVP